MAATHNAEKEGGGMKSSTFISALFALALAACATQEPPKPAPPPEPKPAPAPAPTPAPIQEVKPAPKPEPKKPAVVNLASIELFEFNKATLTDEAKKKLDAEVVAKLKDFGQIRYINVNGHADRLGSAQYNQRLSERRAEAVRDGKIEAVLRAGDARQRFAHYQQIELAEHVLIPGLVNVHTHAAMTLMRGLAD